MIPTPALTLALALLMGHPGPIEGHPGPTTDDASPLVAVEVVARPAAVGPTAPPPPATIAPPVTAALCENFHAQLAAESCPEGWTQVAVVVMDPEDMTWSRTD